MPRPNKKVVHATAIYDHFRHIIIHSAEFAPLLWRAFPIQQFEIQNQKIFHAFAEMQPLASNNKGAYALHIRYQTWSITQNMNIKNPDGI